MCEFVIYEFVIYDFVMNTCVIFPRYQMNEVSFKTRVIVCLLLAVSLLAPYFVFSALLSHRTLVQSSALGNRVPFWDALLCSVLYVLSDSVIGRVHSQFKDRQCNRQGTLPVQRQTVKKGGEDPGGGGGG